MCRAHHQTPAQSDWPADRTSGTSATSNGGMDAPLRDGCGCMHTVMIRDDLPTRPPGSRGRGVQQGQEVAKHARVFARVEAIQALAWGARPCPRPSVLRGLAWGPPLFLRALW